MAIPTKHPEPKRTHVAPEIKQPPRKTEPTDGDIANPVDASDIRTPPEAAVVESWGDRQAREAREAEKRDGQRSHEPEPK